MDRRELLYEGKAKKVWTTDDPGLLVVEYKDEATAFNGEKRATIAGKGGVNNRISCMLFGYLEGRGQSTHLVRQLDERQALVLRLEMIPLEVVVRNVVAGSLSRRLGLPEGTALTDAVVEFYYKNDALGDPLINDDHIRALALCTDEERRSVEARARRVNELLRPLLEGQGLTLIDFKLEFGRDGRSVVLGDEISPDTCRFWDAATGDRLDKDRFRRDMGGVAEAYHEVLRRVERALTGGVHDAVSG